jgi:hypothetical protein
MSAGKVEIGAFRTYPKVRMSTSEAESTQPLIVSISIGL